MEGNLILGNLFSLAAVVCLGMSGWQIVDVVFCMLSNIALYTYSAFTTNFLALIRNVLAYKNKLSSISTLIWRCFALFLGL